jgi:WD40 repeat protein
MRRYPEGCPTVKVGNGAKSGPRGSCRGLLISRFAGDAMLSASPVRCLITALALVRFAQAQSAAPPLPSDPQAMTTASAFCGARATYDDLTDGWRHPSGPHPIPMGTAPVELTIQSNDFNDERPFSVREASYLDFCWLHSLTVGVHISTIGEVSSFTNGEGSFRGGGGGDKLPAETLARLQSLMHSLPDDGRRVPPPARRVTVDVEKNGSATVRLYDSARLPDSIIEMIRLTGARIQIVTPALQPDRALTPEEADSLNLPVQQTNHDFLFVSPDGKVGVLHDFVTKTLTVYEGSSWPQPGLPQGGKIVRVIPEFWQPAVYGGYAVKGEFSPDGRCFLVSWGNRVGALLYDTSTWQPVTDPHLFPQKLKEYVPSPDWNWGIAVTEAGEALVWNEGSHRVQSKLPGLGELEPAAVVLDKNGHRIYDSPSGEIRSAAFSPDRKRVAIYSGPDNVYKLHVSVRDLASGRKVRDFWPVAWESYGSGQPVWWNNGRWLIAPFSSQFSGSGTGLWDAETGRMEGTLDFPDCQAQEGPVALGDRLLQRCSGGKVLEWSVAGVEKQLEGMAAQIAGNGNSPQ